MRARPLTYILPCALVALIALTPARVLVAQATENEPEWTFFGDFRSRVEFDRDSRRSDGTYRADRDRARLRGRAGFTWIASNAVEVTMRVRTGHPDSRQSSHITLGNAFSPFQLTLDRLTATVRRERASIWIGKNAHPFAWRNEVFWDGDVAPEGLGAEAMLWQNMTSTLSLRGGAFMLEPDRNATFAASSHMLALQGVFQTSMSAADILLTTGVERIRENDSDPDPLLGDLDYTLVTASAEVAVHAATTPLRVGTDVSINTRDYAPGVFHRRERLAWVVSAESGLPLRVAWVQHLRLTYVFAHVEKLSVVPGLAHDDWLRWGSLTETRASNYSGHEFRVTQQLAAGQSVMARLYLVDGLVRESATATALETGTRFRLDWNITF